MSFDMEPEDPHGECAAEIHALQAEVEFLSKNRAENVTLRTDLAAKSSMLETMTKERDEALKYAAPVNAQAYVPRVNPCKHNQYWTTAYGACMACRAGDAELQVGDAKDILLKCREILDDELENRSHRHASGRLYAEVCAWLEGKRVQVCKHEGGVVKDGIGVFCKKCGSAIPGDTLNRNSLDGFPLGKVLGEIGAMKREGLEKRNEEKQKEPRSAYAPNLDFPGKPVVSKRRDEKPASAPCERCLHADLIHADEGPCEVEGCPCVGFVDKGDLHY